MKESLLDKDGKEEKEEEEKEIPKLFEGKKARYNSSCCSKLFVSWVEPLVRYANLKEGKLSIDKYGELEKSEEVGVYFDKLEKKWLQAKGKKGDNILFMVLLNSFKGQYGILLFWNTFKTSLELTNPFLIKMFVEYIKTGENKYADTFNFWDLSDSHSFSWLTREMQYGFAIAATMLIQNIICCIIGMNVDFHQNMLGIKSTNALKGLIYKKQLRMSNATNKQFSTGEIINFVQSDAPMLYWLSGFLP